LTRNKPDHDIPWIKIHCVEPHSKIDNKVRLKFYPFWDIPDLSILRCWSYWSYWIDGCCLFRSVIWCIRYSFFAFPILL